MRNICFILVFVVFASLENVSYAVLSDGQCQAVREAHEAFGKELFRKTLESEKSGDLQFAMAALYLNERVDEGNARLRKAHEGILQVNQEQTPSKVMTPQIAARAKWAMRGWLRVYYMFNDKSGLFPGRLEKDLQEKLEDMFWNYGAAKSTVERAEPRCIWVIQGSENHDMMDLSNAFLALQAVKDMLKYKDRKLPDGHTAAEHVGAWQAYYKLYCDERAKQGLFVEISPTYGKYFLPELVNMWEFSEDRVLRKKMEMLLHVVWADWSIDQLGGVRGGGRTRSYQGHYSTNGTSDTWSSMGRILIGKGDWFGTQHFEAQYVLGLTKYRLPNIVIDLALDTAGRGDYVYESLRPAKLVEPPANKPKNVNGYWMDPFGGQIMRYCYETPDYIMGSWMLDPDISYAALNTQNRWQGIIFATGMNSRVFPECEGLGNGKTYNPQVAVQHKNVMIVQRNRVNSKQAGAMRVFFTPGMKDRLKEDQGWFFLQEGMAYLAVKALEREGQAQGGEWKGSALWWPADKDAPLVFVCGKAKDHATLDDFQNYVKGQKHVIASGVLTYRYADCDGTATELKLYVENQGHLPQVNGRSVNLKPGMVFNSPYLQSVHGSGVVKIIKGARSMVLDFNMNKITETQAE